MRIGLVTTSVNNGNFLPVYCAQAEKEGFKDFVTFYVIADSKTPNDLFYKCYDQKRLGFDVRCPYLCDQEDFLSNLDFNLVPYNSDNRRNIGYLMALKDGCDTIISIDDDNYCLDNFYSGHVLAKGLSFEDTYETTQPWVNVCESLGLKGIYPRGYPLKYRSNGNYFKAHPNQAQVMLNAGLWIQEPDLDAHTWVMNPEIRVKEFEGKSFILGHGSWAPINSQNTSIRREALVTYYFIPMGNMVKGYQVDRYGDIFQGYFAEACIKAMGHNIRFGTPIVEHRRNSHNYNDDLLKEFPCTYMMEEFLDWLREVKLIGNSYSECYTQLSYHMENAVEKFKGKIWTVDAKSFIHRTAYCMRQWVKTCNRIGI